MGLKQVRVTLLLLVVICFSDAQWPGLAKVQDLSRFQPPQPVSALRPAAAREPSRGPLGPAAGKLASLSCKTLKVFSLIKLCKDQ